MSSSRPETMSDTSVSPVPPPCWVWYRAALEKCSQKDAIQSSTKLWESDLNTTSVQKRRSGYATVVKEGFLEEREENKA